MLFLPLKNRHFEIISSVAQSVPGCRYITGRAVTRFKRCIQLSKRICSRDLVDERVFAGSLIGGINLESLVGEIPRKRLI